MDVTEIESRLGMYNEARAQRWSHFTKNEDGKYYTDSNTPALRYALEQTLDNVITGALKSYNVNASRESVMKMVTETTTTTSPGIAQFLKFAFPLVRRVWANSIGRELVSVQPMSLPTAVLFTIDHLRDTGGTRLDNRGVTGASDYAADPGEVSTPVRAVNARVTSTSVSAETKKLKSVHSLEAEQDLQSYHGISLSAELLNLIAREISVEIDERIISDLVTGAGAGNITWSSTPSSTLPTEVLAHKKTIKDAFISASNLIYAKEYVPANFIVGGIAEIERLEQLNNGEFIPTVFGGTSGGGLAGQMFGRIPAGTLYGQFKVYKDPWFPVSDQYLVGLKGQSWLETGYVYAPYIPYMVVPSFTNPDSFTVTQAAMARQAFLLKNANFYATVTISGS